MKFYAIFVALYFGLASAQKPCIPKTYRGSDNPMNCICNSTYCDEMPPLGTLGPNQAAIYVSSLNGKRFERSTLTFSTTTTPHNITFKPDDSARNQTVIGFGGAFTDAAGINLAKLSPGAQQNLINSYYGPNGIGYTIGRTIIASCDFSTHVYSYDETPGDMNLLYWKLTNEDYQYKIPFIQMAQNLLGDKLKLFASVWSAPAWMKTDYNETHGGTLIGDVNGPYYKTWANYFIKFFEEYAKNNVTFWGVTMQNEPRAKSSFQSMNYNSSMERDYAKGLWGQTLRSNPLTKNLKLMAMDDSRHSVPDYDNVLFADKDAYNVIDGMAIHWYDDLNTDPIHLTNHHSMYPNKWMLYTEACNEGTPKLGDWLQGDTYMHRIMGVMQHWVAGWTDWNLCLSPQGGPNWRNNFVDAPIIVSETGDTFEKQPMYYALGHIAKFIVPGSVIIGVDTDGVDKTKGVYIESMAAVTPDGKKVLVLNNRNSGHPFDISIINKQGGVINLTIDYRSFVTIVYED